jgi:hypothetical protein
MRRSSRSPRRSPGRLVTARESNPSRELFWTFFFVGAPLPIKDGTGSPLNALAMF